MDSKTAKTGNLAKHRHFLMAAERCSWITASESAFIFLIMLLKHALMDYKFQIYLSFKTHTV